MGNPDATPRGGRPRARAFTLVEILVAMTVLSVIMYVVYGMFVGGIKAFRSEEAKTQSMESAILAYGMILTDLRQQLYFGVPAAELDAKDPITITEDGKKLSFTKFQCLDFGATQLPKAVTEDVVYRLVPSGSPEFKFLERNGQVHQSIRLKDWLFERKDASRPDHKWLRFLNMRIYGYGDRVKDADQDHNLVVGLVALDAYTGRGLSPFWVENPVYLSGGGRLQ